MIPLVEQIMEVEREVRQRGRLYPQWIEQGRLTRSAADEALERLRACQSTMTWLDANGEWIRAEAPKHAGEPAAQRFTFDPVATGIPLHTQLDELQRELRLRERVYPTWVEKRRLKPETAVAKLTTLRAAHATMLWLGRNSRWIERGAQDRLAASVAHDPAVQAVKAAFPEAEITAVRSLVAPSDTRSASRPDGAEHHSTEAHP